MLANVLKSQCYIQTRQSWTNTEPVTKTKVAQHVEKYLALKETWGVMKKLNMNKTKWTSAQIQTQVMETTMVMLQSYSWINTNMLSLMKNVLKFVLKYILSQ